MHRLKASLVQYDKIIQERGTSVHNWYNFNSPQIFVSSVTQGAISLAMLDVSCWKLRSSTS
jgi:hypothetical protein